MSKKFWSKNKIFFSKFVNLDQVIMDMFCGIGYWVLPLAKHQKPRRLICIDKNPDAIEALKSNIKLNKLDPQKFDLILSDCTKVSGVVANRILIGLIPCSCFALEKAVQFLDPKNVGFLHIHHNFTEGQFSGSGPNPGLNSVPNSNFGDGIPGSALIGFDCCEEKRRRGEISSQVAIESETVDTDLFNLANEFGHKIKKCRNDILKIKLLEISKVKSYAPHVYHFVFDFALYFNPQRPDGV